MKQALFFCQDKNSYQGKSQNVFKIIKLYWVREVEEKLDVYRSSYTPLKSILTIT